MRRILTALSIALLVIGACQLSADGAAPTCGKPHKPPCPPPPTTTTPPPTTTTPPPPPPGPTQYRIAVLLINFSDDPRQPWTSGFIDSLYDGPGKSLANFWNDASWGQVAVTADVYGWFTIAVTTAQCPSSQNALSDQADAAATAAGVDLSLYTHRSYVWPANGVSGCRSGGQMPGTRSWNALQTTCSEATGICAARSGLVHEFGHNLGLNHAGDVNGEYGDIWSVMGSGGAMIHNIHRAFLGWSPASQVVTVVTSTTITVGAAGNPASFVYRIPDGTGNYVYLENRAVRTIWENGNGENWPGGKLLLRIAPDYTIPAITTLIDADPGTSPTQVGLPVGSTYTMTNGTTITNFAFGGTDNTVQVGP